MLLCPTTAEQSSGGRKIGAVGGAVVSRMVGGAGCPPLLLLSSLLLANWVSSSSSSSSYSNEFAVFVPAGGETADRLAARYGFHNRGQIGDLSNYFLFEHRGLTKRSANASEPHLTLLTQDPEVAWFEQQRELRRVKRDFQTVKKRDFAQEASAIWDEVFSEFGAGEPNATKSWGETTKQRRSSFPFSDPMFGAQWYINGGGRNGADMNVKRAWERGYSGKGVVVSILDDGIQHNHPDLAQNYDPFASTDINDSDLDPMPQDNGDNKHGTRCAGEVAAVANNNICGVGIAFNASIGGVRMLDGVVNDAVEAQALSLNPDHIDIYSASWGPEDDGRTVDGPGPLRQRLHLCVGQRQRRPPRGRLQLRRLHQLHLHAVHIQRQPERVQALVPGAVFLHPRHHLLLGHPRPGTTHHVHAVC